MTDRSLIAANPATTELFTKHLIAAYEEFINAHGNVGHVDGFMAAHNFHCAIVFDVEQRGEMDAESAKLFRRMAVDTFVQRMKKEPLPD